MVREYGNDQRLIACVIYRENEEPTASELRSHLREVLPDYMLPQHFIAMHQFPVTASGKLDRKKLSASEEQTLASTQQYTAPSTRTEQVLVDIWSKALQRDSISVDSQFFDIGGHSLLALEVILEIEQSCQIRFAPQDMWVNTLEQLAAKIDASQSLGGQPIQQPMPPHSSEEGEKRSWLGRLFGRD